MSHTAELIAVGTELLLGNIANTNAQDLSQALSSVGVNVFWHTVVGDNPARLKEAVEIARKRADVIITTGGLGPTQDDISKDVFPFLYIRDEQTEDFLLDVDGAVARDFDSVFACE